MVERVSERGRGRAGQDLSMETAVGLPDLPPVLLQKILELGSVEQVRVFGQVCRYTRTFVHANWAQIHWGLITDFIVGREWWLPQHHRDAFWNLSAFRSRCSVPMREDLVEWQITTRKYETVSTADSDRDPLAVVLASRRDSNALHVGALRTSIDGYGRSNPGQYDLDICALRLLSSFPSLISIQSDEKLPTLPNGCCLFRARAQFRLDTHVPLRAELQSESRWRSIPPRFTMSCWVRIDDADLRRSVYPLARLRFGKVHVQIVFYVRTQRLGVMVICEPTQLPAMGADGERIYMVNNHVTPSSVALGSFQGVTRLSTLDDLGVATMQEIGLGHWHHIAIRSLVDADDAPRLLEAVLDGKYSVWLENPLLHAPAVQPMELVVGRFPWDNDAQMGRGGGLQGVIQPLVHDVALHASEISLLASFHPKDVFQSASQYASLSFSPKHNDFGCDGCDEFPLFGIRWTCCDCLLKDLITYDLCTACMKKMALHGAIFGGRFATRHASDHKFLPLRYSSESSPLPRICDGLLQMLGVNWDRGRGAPAGKIRPIPFGVFPLESMPEGPVVPVNYMLEHTRLVQIG